MNPRVYQIESPYQLQQWHAHTTCTMQNIVLKIKQCILITCINNNLMHGGFFLACEDLGRMSDHSFPTCAFCKMEISVHTHSQWLSKLRWLWTNVSRFLCLFGFNWICSLLILNRTCTALWASGWLLTEGFSALEVYLLLLLSKSSIHLNTKRKNTAAA